MRSSGKPRRVNAASLVASRSNLRSSRRTGAPVKVALFSFVGKYATADAAALRDCNLVASPGSRSYETVTTGISSFVAARVAATLPYPPTEITTLGCRARNRISACAIALRNENTALTFCFTACGENFLLNPCTSKSVSGIFVGGTNLVSTPLIVPTKCRCSVL